MSKNKKIVLGLSILFTMLIAFVIGIVANNYTPTTNNNPTSSRTNKKYAVVEATNNNKLSINYQPDSNTTSSSSEDITNVYEYCFGNTMSSETMAINLLTDLQNEANVANVNIQYAYSTSKLETIPTDIRTYSIFETQSIPTGSSVYIYVFVDVIDESQSAQFDVDLQWAYGSPMNITYIIDGETITDTQVQNSQIYAHNTNGAKTTLGYGIEEWYTDSACTTPVSFPITVTAGKTLYAKQAANLNPDWLVLNSDGTYYQVQYPEGTTESAIVGDSEDLIIPSRYNDLPVMKIANQAFTNQIINRLIIPASITSMEYYLHCGNGDTFTLNYITIAQANTKYDSRNNCNAIINTSANKIIQASNNAYIPDGIVDISYQAFRHCKALQNIYIPASVKTISNTVFADCSGLESVTFAEDSQLKSIDNWAFRSCPQLQRITIPASVTQIGSYIFNECTSLRSVAFEDTNTWYATTSSSYSGGDAISVVDNVTNVTNFVTTYVTRYWYKSAKTVNMIYDADDLLAINNNSNSYEYYQLANDIDLNVYESTTLSAILNAIDPETNTSGTYAMIDVFTGRIDGAGYTIKMPNNAGDAGYVYIIGEFNGELCNVTLDYSELGSGQEVSWARACRSATRFRNTLTKGTLNVSNMGNYSPLIIYAYAHLSFINCTNDMNISGPIRYGSPFLGGAVFGTRDYTIVNDVEKMYLEIIKDINVSYENCVNNGELVMQYAAMLQGNSYKIPNKDNLYISNCVNNGQIIGTLEANYFCSVYQDWYPDFAAWNEYAQANITNGYGAFCGVKTLETLSTTYDPTTGIISVHNTGADANDYTYRLQLSAYITYTNGSGHFIITEMDVNLGETNYGFYRFVDDTFLATLTNYTKVAVTGTNMSYNVVSNDIQLYLITDTATGTKYYYYDLYSDIEDESDKWYVVNNPEWNCAYFTYSIVAYDSTGWAGSLTVDRPI